MSDLYGQEISEEEAKIHLRALSSRELKSLTEKQENLYNIQVEGFQDDSQVEYYDANPEEEIESMNLTAIDCDTLKKYIKSEETYEGYLVCDDCLRKK